MSDLPNTEPVESSSSGASGFDFAVADVVRLLTPTLTGFVGLVVSLHLLNGLDWLPSPRPVRSTDDVLMHRRFEMTRAPSPAEVLIIGDSSSAIDVEAPLLRELLPGRPEVLNQGMFMGLGMDIYGEAAGEFIRHHPGQVKLVVLLITAEQLQNRHMSTPHQRLWRGLMNGEATASDDPAWRKALALDVARERVASHLAPFVLHGHAALFYLHPFHLRQHLEVHDGSMVESGWYNPANRMGAQAFDISGEVLREAGALRQAIPSSVKLAAAITPLPDSNIPATFRTRRDELLRNLNESLRADLLLTNLPVRLPNGCFSSPFHLNPRGAEHYTRLLAAELRQQD